MSERGVDAWVEATTTFDRVKSVTMTLDEPKTAPEIADHAHVAENTARNHLKRLVDLHVVLMVNVDSASRTYKFYPDPLYTRMHMLRDLFDEHDHDGLVEKRATLLETLDEIQETYEADSPTALRERAAETDDVEEIRDLRKTASDWELLAFRLSLVDEAIRTYDTYANPVPEGTGREDGEVTDDDVLSNTIEGQPRLSEEQADSPGIADWVEAKRIGRDLDPDR